MINYQSPIEIITNNFAVEVENKLYKAVFDVGINVDKAELIRALEYDRNQYEKGYKDALERKKGKWMISEIQREEDTINGNYLYICSCCNFSDTHAKTQIVPYCWHCGADMRGENDD